MNIKILSFSTLVTLFTLNGHAESWDHNNDPAAIDTKYEYRLSALPIQGELANKPWSETYWATNLGSINIRWNQTYPQGFGYSLANRDQVMHMSRSELMMLSPSEKFDLLLGHYDYPLHYEVSGFASPRVASWHGICDGWSMSAIQFTEPKPVDAINPDGIVIPFGSSDLKGLLSYNAQFRSKVEINRVGTQCTKWGRIWGNGACADINAGAMHVVMANQLGIKREAFIMDRDPGPEIWNQPVYGFKTEIMGSANNGVQVHTTLYYTDELDYSSWTPVGNTPQFKFDKMEMDYTLDLDSLGKITGGNYLHGSDHPDLFWKPTGQVKLEDEFVALKALVSSSK